MIFLAKGCEYIGKHKAENFCSSINMGSNINKLLSIFKSES